MLFVYHEIIPCFSEETSPKVYSDCEEALLDNVDLAENPIITINVNQMNISVACTEDGWTVFQSRGIY